MDAFINFFLPGSGCTKPGLARDFALTRVLTSLFFYIDPGFIDRIPMTLRFYIYYSGFYGKLVVDYRFIVYLDFASDRFYILFKLRGFSSISNDVFITFYRCVS